VKIADSKYITSGVRVNEWIKLKHTALGGIGDTLDLVPIAAFYGKGNRTGKLGSFLMGAFNRETKKFESICKVGTGFKYADLDHFSSKLNYLHDNPSESEMIARSMYKVASSIKPDVWLQPTEVWEIQADSYSLSSVHYAGRTQIK
jgi:DNA ligase 1